MHIFPYLPIIYKELINLFYDIVLTVVWCHGNRNILYSVTKQSTRLPVQLSYIIEM